ncbi:MAG: type III-A CRISPR-associated protein Cas10/Csm1 [Chloroflexota bacterium]|nr:type III-A CRISPR-associated protein Cas10/Csm1 [Chloroflexota bacterium]
MRSTHDYLIAYGWHLMCQVAGIEFMSLPESGDLAWVESFEKLLGTAWPEPKTDVPLTSIFSRVYLLERDQEDSRKARRAYLEPAPLDMKGETLFPRHEPPGDLAAAKESVGQGFQQAYTSLPQMVKVDDSRFFTTFYHLMERFAWALPNTYGEPGVSLFQQWKAVAALVFASGGIEEEPEENFTLVGGDIPGIQRMIYTITSKGAAKALRGRSLFIQLLGDAVVRRLVHKLGLSQANVIYAAGGNFMLLAPAGESTQDVLGEVSQDVNKTLLGAYKGDVALCLANVQIPAGAVSTAEFGTKYSLDLQRAIARQKARRFVEIANGQGGWEEVFEPRGSGGERPNFCAVCQAELSLKELEDESLLLVDMGELEPGETAPRACSDCATFRKLAEAVGRLNQALYLRRGKGAGGDRWQGLLHKLSAGWWYRFADWDEQAAPGETKYTLNDVDFINHGAHGFLFLSNTTPRVTQADVAWWDETYPDQRGEVKIGNIRNFELLAHAAEADRALERVGVLRMDVDSLGRVMTRGLFYGGETHRSMPATSALSTSVDRFFAGYLDVLCRKVTETPDMAGLPGHEGEDLLYVIYAGGDDLFVVGSWHLLPLLAEQVRGAFERYVGENPFLHISAGITLEGRRFPLYQAATRAGAALDGGAKRHEYTEKGLRLKKNAVHFLGQTLGWSDFAAVRERADALACLVNRKDVSRGLLHTLQMVYHRFREDRREARRRGLSGERMYYGPWMWRQAYYLKRFARGKPQEVQDEIKAVQDWNLTHRVQYLGLATRWAEYLTRVKKEE